MPIIFIFTNADADDRYQDKLYSKGCKHMSKDERHKLVLEQGIQFRLTDDDGELHFEGKYLDLNNPRNINFEPLDMQQENTGCVNLEYLQDDVWCLL
jgi:hypothetical protein